MEVHADCDQALAIKQGQATVKKWPEDNRVRLKVDDNSTIIRGPADDSTNHCYKLV